MSLFIEVYVGQPDRRKLVAQSVAHNVSNLADLSDYTFKSVEYGAPHLGLPERESTGEIHKHNRNTTVWSLIKKIVDQS